MSILRRFGFAAPAPEQAGVLEAIEAALARLEPRRAELVAVFAALLARVAHADEDVSEAETAEIARIVAAEGGLPDEEAKTVAAIARQHTVVLRGGDRHRLTRRANEIAGDDEKRRIVRCLYALAACDALVTHVEDAEVRSVADALLLPRSEVLEMRSGHRDDLEEMRELRKARERR